jgi:hypothetical protein
MPSFSVASIALLLADAQHPFFHQSLRFGEDLGEDLDNDFLNMAGG